MTEAIELQVVAEARRGNTVALIALYEHFKQDVFRFIYYRTSDAEVAADLTGDVFEQMLKALPTYRAERPFAAWLFQIARNRVIDFWRQQQVRQHVALNEAIEISDDSLEQMVEQRLTVERVVWAFRFLTDDQQDVLIMRFIAGMQVSIVADALDKSEGAVRMLQHRGLQGLRSRLLLLEEVE